MSRVLSVASESFPIAGAFTISRGAKTEAEVIACTIVDGANTGRGECVPYTRYGESVASVRAQIEALAGAVAGGLERQGLTSVMKPGAARNAVDCALWDLEAKIAGRRVAEMIGEPDPVPLQTTYTLSLADPAAMASQARANAWRPLLKVKIGRDGDLERIRAVVEAAPASRIILDANEGWTVDNVEENLRFAAGLGIALVEQPLPAGADGILGDIPHPVPLCADESMHGADDLERLVGLYDAVNLKLDKTGGLTAALSARDKARELGFSIMVGCMVGTSLGIAPAVLLAQGAEYVDLDGPLLLARDREPSLRYEGALVSPPEAALWG